MQHMAKEDDNPPSWVLQLVKNMSVNITSEDPIQWHAHFHEDEGEEIWHIEVSPTLYKESDGVWLRNYHVHVSPILKLIKQSDIIADPDLISIYGKYKTHSVHVMLVLQPDEDSPHDIKAGTTDPALLN